MQRKFCKDCKYFNADMDKISNLLIQLNGPKFEHARQKSAICTHRLSMKITDDAYKNYLVTGQHENVEPVFKYCVIMREDYSPCGEDAKLFEPIEHIEPKSE